MVADHVRTYYNLQCTIDWHPPDAKGWITGDIRNNPLPGTRTLTTEMPPAGP